MILAGDIGGTHSRLALFESGRGEPSVPPAEPAALEVYPSAEHGGLPEVVRAFLEAHPAEPRAATFGVAGPVRDGRTDAVNLAWPVEAGELAAALRIAKSRVSLINDLQANAWGIPSLGPEDLSPLNDGTAVEGGAMALISAGTGLGEAFITFGPQGPQIHPSEGGHVEFGPRSALESGLRDWLTSEDRHISYEDVCSGMGLVNIYEFLRSRASEAEPQWLAKQRQRGDDAAAISAAGLERRDPVAEQALDLMISIYGAQAGNLALTVMATGGVYLGGGIAPRILPRLREGRFMRAFTDKGRLSSLLERVPVLVILNEQTALLGAARHALVHLG